MTIPDSGTNDPAPTARARIGAIDAATLALAFVLLATTVIRLSIAADRPLWLDEVWTGMIVSQRSLTEFARQCAYDINAPLYYVITGLWARVAGVSNFALRFPAMAFGVLAPLVALTPRRMMGRTCRYAWSVLLACWIPGLLFALEARYYTLYLFLGVANAIAFCALLRSPTQARAWIWTGVSALLALSHYYGFILAGVQGLAYLAFRRGQALRTWPAALAFLPAFASLAVHAARLTLFAQAGRSWIPLVGLSDIIPAVGFVVGALPTMLYLLVWAGVALYYHFKAAREGTLSDAAPVGRELWITAGCAVLAMGLAVGLGMFKPMFIQRYLIGFTPGVMLGLALLAERFERSWARAPLFLVAAYFLLAVKLAFTPLHNVTPLNFEAASNALMTQAPRRLAFMWDNPTQPEASALRGVGGFFFDRAGHPVDVDPVRARSDQDPNAALLQQASGPGTAILWIYDLNVEGTAALRFPPRIAAIDPRWRCRNFGKGPLGVIGCSRVNSGAAPGR